MREGGLWYGRLALVATCMAMLVTLWAAFWIGKVKESTLLTLTPILLALIPVGFLLPLLTKLKLLGVEAELSQPKEKVSKGPTGEFGFSK